MGQDRIFENTLEVGETELKEGGNIGDRLIDHGIIYLCNIIHMH
jgi:hypothetical protein